MQYFIIVNGTQKGPFSKEELRLQNITIKTMVWHEGMSDWAPAAHVPELADLLVNETVKIAPPSAPANPGYSANPPYGQPVNPYNSYGNNPYPDNMNGNIAPHTNWMPWAIVFTILGFCTSCIGGIIGIFAIVNANKANNYYNMGMDAQGAANNSSAKTLTILAIIFDVIGIIASIAYFSYFSANMAQYV
ncbi:MAG: DUF4339 domain-containing protein [Muribaculaceae bacterium]|nr:DUF4339 domain-containing protein [Muribaculaceae bacterium]